MKERLFRFKRFNVSHARSSMPIGVDGVLIGAWASSRGGRVLDVGTGCGVIALMLAQRDGQAVIRGIDVDLPSVEEASMNFINSPWRERLSVDCVSFCDLDETETYDLIVSNPPFYDAGMKDLDTARKRARHSGELSPESLVCSSESVLSQEGVLSMIVPAETFHPLVSLAADNGLTFARGCFVRDHHGSPEKRVMLEFVKNVPTDLNFSVDSEPAIQHLTMFESNGEPTPEYRRLCGQFYLKF